MKKQNSPDSFSCRALTQSLVLVLAFFLPSLACATTENNSSKEKAAVCAACHGAEGVSPNPIWPNLAGQHAPYLVKQLEDFKEAKKRNDASMAPMVANLSTEDMRELATFYASLPLPQGSTPKKYLARGQQLYRGGDFDKHISACIACHGPKGKGNSQAGFPALSGQHAAYTIEQLKAYKTKKRSTDLNAIMHDISLRMSDEDMEAVAYYIQGLH